MTLIATWLWQGLAIAWITAAAMRAMPRLNAATRHAIWWLALVAVVVLPVAHVLAAITTATPSLRELTPRDTAAALMLPAIPDGILAAASAVWAMTAAFGLMRIASGCRRLGRLKRASSRFDCSRERRLRLWTASRRSARRAGELRVSDAIAGACVLGFGRPAILVSRAVADALSDESLDQIVMHEQAHLDRYDDWSQLLLAVVGSLAGWHPAVRFLARRIDLDREAACDDRVVSCTGAARRYASSLLEVAAASNPAGSGVELAAAVPTATTTASALRVRVSRLLDPNRDRGARLARVTSLAGVTALSLAVFMSTRAAPAVVFLDAADVNPSAAAPEIDTDRAPEPARITSVAVPARTIERAPRRRITRVERPPQLEPPEAAAHPVEGTALEPPPRPPLDSRTMATIVKAPGMTVASPSGLLAVLVPAPAQAAPWEAVRTSTASAAGDVARAAAATGARAKSAGVSIGRFMTRASRAGANAF